MPNIPLTITLRGARELIFGRRNRREAQPIFISYIRHLPFTNPPNLAPVFHRLSLQSWPRLPSFLFSLWSICMYMVMASVRIPEIFFKKIWFINFFYESISVWLYFFNTVNWVFVTKIKILGIFPFSKLIHSKSIPTKISDWFVVFCFATFSMVGAKQT